jgi:hypothetical protein
MKAPRVEVLEGISPRIERGEVLRLLGYRRGRRPPAAAVATRIDELLEEAQGLVDSRACFTFLPADAGARSGPFRGAETIAFSVATIGRRLEDRVAALSARGETARALVLDAIGSAGAEAVADHVNATICRRATQEGNFTSRRVSPGYRSWPIGAQAQVFALLPSEVSGVRLRPTFLMEPQKSVSAAVGIGRHLEHSKYAGICTYCDLRDCAFRRPLEGAHACGLGCP